MIPSTCPTIPLSLSTVSSLPLANALSLQRLGFPAFGRRIVMARVEARGELTAHGTKQDATIEYCIHRKDDTRERGGVRGRRRAQKRESKRVGSRRDESTRRAAEEAGGQRVRARERE